MADRVADTLYIGSVSATALSVTPMAVEPGQMAYVSTYGGPIPCREQTDAAFSATTAAEACRHLVDGSLFATFEKPVCAAAWVSGANGPEVAVFNP